MKKLLKPAFGRKMMEVALVKGALTLILLGLTLGVTSSARAAPNTSVPTGDIVALGRALFFDERLSVNGTQSCGSCHDPLVGFTGPDGQVNRHGGVMPGALPRRFGNRKPPSAAYGGESPTLRYDDARGEWVGGMFWDGRATGLALGDPLAEQAQGPFLNPLEQAMPHAKQVCLRVAHSDYARLFEAVWGKGTMKVSYVTKNVELTYERIARSIAAYERSAEVNPFSSKFDLFWDNAVAGGKDVEKITFSTDGAGSGAAATAVVQGGTILSVTVTQGGSGYLVPPKITFGGGGGMGGGGMGTGATAVATVEDGAVVAITVTSGGSGYRPGPGSSRVNITAVSPYHWSNFTGLGLTDQEVQGLAAFNDPGRGDCSRCHSLTAGETGRPLFTDFKYWNIGVPKNPENPFYSMPPKWNPQGADWVDYGLGAFLQAAGYSPEVYEPELGKFKTPTLRNVDLRPSDDFVKAYGHNGFFKSLEEIVLFYTWRAHTRMMAEGGCGGGMGGGGMGGGGMGGGGMGGPDPNLFPLPEVSLNLEPLNFICGPQAMTDQANILAFLKTLSDGYFAR